LEKKNTSNKIGVILLAAGESSRLGQPKQLLVHDGKTLLQHSLEVANASVATPVVLVLGAKAGVIKNEIDGGDAVVVVNTEWEEGMASSIRIGIKTSVEMSPLTEGMILMVCDQPYINASLLNELVAAHHNKGKAIVTCGYADTVGPPTLFHKSLFPELLRLRGDVGARSVLNKHLDEVEVIAFPQGHLDIDTREDFKKLSTGHS
jgi:molybdenum cofactor cytidylyltransferase